MEPCWKKFLMAFGRVLDSRSQQVILKAWSRPEANRTAFYANDVLPAVAKELELVCRGEFLNIDHVFRDLDRVPRVFIESENRPETAEDEIWKLCAVSCSLRVLLTVVEWDKTAGVWTSPDGSRQDELLCSWGKIAKTHDQVCPNPGLLGLLVGELCDPEVYRKPTHPEFQHKRFRFYAHHFVPETKTWPADGTYQRYLDGSMPDDGQCLGGWPH